MREIGVDPRGVAIMADKFEHYQVRIFDLTFRQAAIIKQEMLARGAEAAVPWQVCSWEKEETGYTYQAFLSGTRRQLDQFIAKLKQQPFGLEKIAAKLETALNNYSGAATDFKLLIQGKTYDLKARAHIMGIINLTPDSFSYDGLYGQAGYIDLALKQAEEMVAAGADFLDLGGESTRPGAEKVSADEEAKRLLPVLKELTRAVSVPISVDTYKPAVAEAALEMGAVMINDIWGLRSPDDPEGRMAQVAASAKCPVILMHNREEPEYRFLMKEIIESLEKSIEIALAHGVDFEQIIIDPGIGFGKTYHHNLQTLQNLDQLRVLGRPILLGTSRKSVIGLTLDLPVEERLEGTIAANLWGVAKGANVLRVHDVKAATRAVRMYEAIANA
ncbi:MAG: dihydropteroate synthase [Firmicutes bacterium]|nr:dihydropteroate synthase [Bacillota bacterium]